MLTIEKLKEYGADTASGLSRCVNNEALYLRLTNMVPTNSAFKSLYDSINANNLDEAFSAAHALKGILLNLSITPLSEPVSTICELLRNKTEYDYSSYISLIEEKRKELEELCN